MPALPPTCKVKFVMRFVVRLNSLLLVVCLSVVTQAEDWPWFLGPRHDGTSAETGLNLHYSVDGPPLLWKQKIGTGYSAPSVLGDRLVIHHREGDREIVSCRNVADGSEVWEHSYPSTYSDPYGYNNGPRCSPVLTDAHCFTLGAEGMLCCTDMKSGTVVWQHALQDEFDLPDWFFGVGCSPVLDQNRLIVPVGAQNNSGIVAFEASTGNALWKAVGRETWDGVTDIHTRKPYEWTGEEMVVSYSSPIIATIHGQRHLLCYVRQGLVSLDPETGRERFKYWFRPRVHESVNAARPVVVDDQIFLSSAYRLGSVLLQVEPDGTSVREVWRNDDNMLAHWSTPIHVDGFIYGFSGRHENEGELRCVQLSDGKLIWQTSGFEGSVKDLARNPQSGEIVDRTTGRVVPFPYFGRGSLTQLGDRFLVLGERGTLATVHVNSKEFLEDCRAKLEEVNYPAWTAPVVSNGRLYLRSEDWLLCLDLRPGADQQADQSAADSGSK